MRRAVAFLAVALLLATPAAAQEARQVGLRVGSHPGHGRIVFDWPTRVGYSVREVEGRVVLHFDSRAAFDLPAPQRLPRNVLTLAETEGGIAIGIPPGARLRHFRLDNRVVLDVLDPPRGNAVAAAPAARVPEAAPGLPVPPLTPPMRVSDVNLPAADGDVARRDRNPPGPATLPATPVLSPPRSRPPPPARVGDPAAFPPAAAATPPSSPSRATADIAAALPIRNAERVRSVPGSQAIAVPVPADTGLALFRRGVDFFALFDRPLALDLSALRRHPVFAALEVQVTADATVVRLPLGPPARLMARRDTSAWVLEPTRDGPPADAPLLRAVPDAGPPARIALEGLETGAAGGVIAMADPLSGAPLLVATLRRLGPGVVLARRAPDLDLLPSGMGAVVLVRSDRITMRPLADRFVLEAASGGGLSLGSAPVREISTEIRAMSRTLDLPDAPVPALMERLRQQLLAVNEAPPLARGPRRRDAAETLLALGLPQEAQAMTLLAQREDPRARDDPRVLLAHGAAALLGGRLPEAAVLADPRLPATDEVALWRALRAAMAGEEAAPAALAATAPLLLAYPAALGERLLPVALEAMAEGGEEAEAARLLAAAGEAPGLDLARAILAESMGDTAAALASYNALIAGRDRRQRAIAQRRAAELRLASGAIDAPAAADLLDRSLFAWRGGVQEVAQRRRIAALRLQAGEGQAAFALLEETGRLFPAEAEGLKEPTAAAFLAALEQAPPLAAATLFDAHRDLLAEDERGESAILLLADRLAQLDLVGRAAELLEQAARRATAPARAAIGARLADLHLAEGEEAAALVALDRTEGSTPPEPLAQRRALLRARALTRQGDAAAAEAVLARLGPSAAEARAELRVDAQDWTGAAAAQMEFLGATLPPPSRPLSASERASVARAAAYASLAGDDALLASLRDAHGPRMAEGPLAGAFVLLTADPVRGMVDMRRLGEEIGMLRLLPGRLEALRAPTPVAR